MELDEQLGADRGNAGEPSATDFLVIDLPPIVERFATDFGGLPEISPGLGRLEYSSPLDGSSRAVVVYGFLAADGAVDLIGVELDL